MSVSITFFAWILAPQVKLSPTGDMGCVLPNPLRKKRKFLQEAQSSIDESRGIYQWQFVLNGDLVLSFIIKD